MPLNKDEVLAKLKAGESLEGVEIGEVDFSEYKFDFLVDFRKAIFTGKAKFYNAQFNKKAYFRLAKFRAKTNFNRAEFVTKADFSLAEFVAEANFSWVSFGAEACFIEAKFGAMANFNQAEFVAKAYFSQAEFANRVVFEGNEEKSVFTKGQPVSFQYVIFEKPTKVIFRSLYLGDCSFENTDVSQLDFSDVTWGKKEGFLVTRKVIYDEVSDKENKNYRLIEETYRQLKKNYEGQGSYGEAGDFHYGELEMQRKAQGRFFQYVSINTMYKILSGYGEKHWRTLFWLGTSIGLFASFYLVGGIKSETEYIGYKLAWDVSPLTTGDFWQHWVKGLIHALQIATFSRRSAFTAASLWTSGLEIAQQIITPILVTLAVLAIRRKFKR